MEPSSGGQSRDIFAKVERPLENVEGYARGWLLGIFFGASRDPRREIDEDDVQSYLMETVGKYCQDRWFDKADEGIPPVEVCGRRLVRRPRTLVANGFSAGSSAISVRWPAWKGEEFRTSVPHGRSAYAATAVRRELAIVNHTSVNVVMKRDAETGGAFYLGLMNSIPYGASLRPSATLDRAHVEDLVGREISAYLLEPVLPHGRRRQRPGRSRTR